MWVKTRMPSCPTYSLTITHCPLSIDRQEERCGKTSLQGNAQCGIGNWQCPRYLNAIDIPAAGFDRCHHNAESFTPGDFWRQPDMAVFAVEPSLHPLVLRRVCRDRG